jgi:phosphoribosyl-ATP pyrophosphohydrolase/phosphoribosyl-AMP cyclohydrolase/histidinol dehydrogenase
MEVEMTERLLKNLVPAEVLGQTRNAVSSSALAAAETIIETVRRDGREALMDYGRRFEDLGPDNQLVYGKDELAGALERIPGAQRKVLERTAERIGTFAAAQREIIQDMEIPVQGGRAGWRFFPVKRAGCYAPGGRFPLPSSVLMTTVTAKTAGVGEIWVASPRPVDLTLAAAAVGGADALVAVGGAQAIAALAYGVEGIPRCDVIVGPGNRYVTAAKQLVTGQVGIDMLAGPSELVILADASADPATIAADLLAQAEHDPDAVPILVTDAHDLVEEVNRELTLQLADLPTAEIAVYALGNGGAVKALDLEQAVALCNALAPEHLELIVEDPDTVAGRLDTYGALFLGGGTAEVLGDYGAGPNHVLPTGGTARFSGPLSVQDFLVGRTWLRMEPGPESDAVARDAIALARIEGLEGHARSAELRLG